MKNQFTYITFYGTPGRGKGVKHRVVIPKPQKGATAKPNLPTVSEHQSTTIKAKIKLLIKTNAKPIISNNKKKRMGTNHMLI